MLWLRADLGVTTSGGNVTAWNDQSGVGDANRNFAPVNADRPALNTADASYNNQPTIGTFNQAGSFNDTRLVSGTWNATYTTPFILVIGHALGAGSKYFTQASGTDFLALLNSAGTGRAFAGAAATSLSGGSMTTAPGLIACSFNGASSQFFCGAISSATSSGPLTASTLGDEPFSLGSNSSTPSSTTFAVERIAEVIVYSSLPSASDRALLRAYLNTRYGASFT